MTHNKPKTYPRLATPIVFVPPEDLGEAVEAAIRLQRDHGDRGDRRHARLKYLVEEQGVDWIKARRSEEHTSELQSLMRISYAVFCLTKKQHQALPTTPHYLYVNTIPQK